MTIMTPIEGITAPPHPGSPVAAPIAETFLPYDETPLLSSRRADGWSAANQRLFLQAIAEGYGVEQATLRVGLSAASAYAFRRTAKGAAFALGWRAANLVARDAIAETLLVRALEGQVSTITRANGDIVTRHHHDNGLAMRLLARLDRQVETAPDADVKAARLVAQEFDAFLDLVEKDEGPARAGLFLARRCGTLATSDEADPHDLAPIYALAAADRFARTGLATASEVDITDLDPAARAIWTAEQWQRAEAAGLLALAAPEPASAKSAPEPQDCQLSPQREEENPPVRWDPFACEYRTSFPPPDDFDGDEHGDYGHVEYERTLTPAELAAMGGDPLRYDEAQLAEQAEERDAFFAALVDEAEVPLPPGASGRSCSQHDLNSVGHCSPDAGRGASAPKGEGDEAETEITLTQSNSRSNSGTATHEVRSHDEAGQSEAAP